MKYLSLFAALCGIAYADTVAVGPSGQGITSDTKSAFLTALGGSSAGKDIFNGTLDPLARANHTGTQATSTITGLDTALGLKSPLVDPVFTHDVSVNNFLNVAFSSGTYHFQVDSDGNSNSTGTANANAGLNAAWDGSVFRFHVDSNGSVLGANLTGSNTGDETTATIKTKLGITTLSGVNTGDQTTVSGNAGTATALQTGRTISVTGDMTWTSPSFDGSGNVSASGTVTKVNGTPLAALATGIIKNTTGTGVPSIAVAGTDYQAPLVSGTNIKTLNGLPMLGSGDLAVSSAAVEAIPNKALWVEADSLALADGALIPSIADKSGSGNSLTQVTTGKQPAFSVSGINGRPALVFSGGQVMSTGSSFFVSGTDLTSAMTTFIVMAETGTAPTGDVLPINNELNWFLDTKFPFLQVGYGGLGTVTQIGRGNMSEPQIICENGSGTAGTAHSMRINGKLARTGLGTIPTTLSGALNIGGGVSSGTFYLSGKIAAVLVFKRSLTAAETQTVESYLSDKYLPKKKQLVFIGDSLTMGWSATAPYGGLPDRVTPLVGGGLSEWRVEDLGVGGLSAQTINVNATEMLRYISPASNNTVIIWPGSNDLANASGSASVTAAYNAIVAICGKARAQGMRVVVATTLPRNGGLSGSSTSLFETDRTSLNSQLRSNYTTFADALADIGADATIGATGKYSDTTYYAGDQTHLLDAGYTVAAPIFAAAIKTAIGIGSVIPLAAKTPASATDTGTTGQVCWDASYIYVCTATNTWKRSAIAAW